MYLTVLFLPLIGSILSGFLGRKIGVKGSHFITTFCLFLASILASITFFEVGVCNSPVIVNMGN
jgi:NADH-ubiquinone oxidoreductase chain 5